MDSPCPPLPPPPAADVAPREPFPPSSGDPAEIPVTETPSDASASLDAPQDSVFEDAEEAPTAEPLSDDLQAQIVRQVEYYFSDENLPMDKFMLKHVKKGKEGFVPIAVIASFRRMKRLVQDLSLIEAVLRTSSQLVVSSDGKRVRRINPLPASDPEDAKPCTVFVENLPEDCSTESLQKLFENIGKITNITIHDPHALGESVLGKKAKISISSKLHALVEYDTVEAAEKAVATLNDDKNWRSGMRVELLPKRMGKYGLVQKARKENSEKNDNQASDVSADGHNLKSVCHNEAAAENGEGEIFGGGKGRGKGRHRNRGRGYIQKSNEGQGHGSTLNNENTSKLIQGPRMPDGTRGFAIGRGKPAIKDGMNALEQ